MKIDLQHIEKQGIEHTNTYRLLKTNMNTNEEHKHQVWSSPNWAQHNLQRQSPSGAFDRGGEQQYIW